MTEAVRVGDIQALNDFLARLVAFNRDLADGLANVRGHWSGVGHVWNDDMYRRFGDALSEVTPGIDHYLAATENHEAYLRELIHRLEEVVRLRGSW